MTKSDKLYYFKKISIFFILIPMFLMCMLLCVPTRNSLEDPYADYIVQDYTFVGSNVNTYVAFYNSSLAFDSYHFINVTCSYSFNNGDFDAVIRGSFFRNSENGVYSFNYAFSSVAGGPVFSPTFGFFPLGNPGYGFRAFVTHSTYVSPNITNIRMYVDNIVDYDGNSFDCNVIKYSDAEGNHVSFYFPCSVSSSSYWRNFNFTDRTYYIALNFNDNTYYQTGYTDGYNAGYTDGEDVGYQDGYNVGENVGYNNGYNVGIHEANDYSFLSLMGAVIDAPVNAFTSLLNFEFLGFNILSFVTGILTILIIVFVIKLAFGK